MLGREEEGGGGGGVGEGSMSSLAALRYRKARIRGRRGNGKKEDRVEDVGEDWERGGEVARAQASLLLLRLLLLLLLMLLLLLLLLLGVMVWTLGDGGRSGNTEREAIAWLAVGVLQAIG